MNKFNKVLWYIPLIGVIYVFYSGFKYGFLIPIENPLKLFWEGIIGGFIQASSIWAVILTLIHYL